MFLGACAHEPLGQRAGLFADHLFGPARERISAHDVFALSEPMQR